MTEQQPPSRPSGDSRNGSAATPKPWYRRWWGITLVVLAAIVVLGLVVGDPDDEPVAELGPEPETVAEEEPTPADEHPTPAPTPEAEEPEEAREAEEAEQTAEPDRREALAAAAFDPIELSGTGDDVVDLAVPDDLPAFVEVTHDGEGNVAIWSRDADGTEIDLLVNEIGAYEGRRPVNFDDPPVAMLEITAAGGWTVSAHPLADAPELEPGGSLHGDGDDMVVLFDELPGSQRAQLTHAGEGNFAIWAWGDRVDLLVNDIGAYEGTVLIDAATLALDITADGPWTITLD